MVHNVKLKNKAFSKIKLNMSSIACASTILFATSCGNKDKEPSLNGEDRFVLDLEKLYNGLQDIYMPPIELYIKRLEKDPKDKKSELIKAEKSLFKGIILSCEKFKAQSLEAGIYDVGYQLIKLKAAKPANSGLKDSDFFAVGEYSNDITTYKWETFKDYLGNANNKDFEEKRWK